ncbi:unnamed protein product, partial [Cylicocyclus nassatus]
RLVNLSCFHLLLNRNSRNRLVPGPAWRASYPSMSNSELEICPTGLDPVHKSGLAFGRVFFLLSLQF